MKNTMIEIISNEELVDLLISTANEVEIVSESNLLACVREEVLSRLTQRAGGRGGYAPRVHTHNCGCEVCVNLRSSNSPRR